MDANYIKPFIASIQNVFSTMMQLEVRAKTPYLKENNNPDLDVSGVIGMSGDVTGSVILSFPQGTAENLVALFSGTKADMGSPEFADAIGELVNMVAGGAKAMFKNRKCAISTPSVIVGKSHRIAHQSDVPCVVIPCGTNCGDLHILIAIKPSDTVVLQASNTPATVKV
jgi:chemotaxis protein CheX